MKEKFKHFLLFNIFFIGALIGVETLNILSPSSVNNYFCLIPRNFQGFQGIFLSHFEHAGIGHSTGNVFYLLILSFFILIQIKLSSFMKIFFSILILEGALLWIFGRTACHIGASGIVFGLWGFLISQALFSRKITDIVISMFIILTYGGFVYGVSPFQQTVSWEAHLFGIIAGVFVSYFSNIKITRD